MVKLSDDEVRAALGALAGWRLEGGQVIKDYAFPTFPDAIAFVQRVAERAEAANHHPDLDIRYTRVRAALSTHSAGGITDKDIDLAQQIDACASEA